MAHIGVNVNQNPTNLDTTYSLSTSQEYIIQCTALGNYIEEDRQRYEVHILFAASAPSDMDQAFFDSMVLMPKGPHFSYRPKAGLNCYVWCPYGPSRISFVEER